MKNNIIIILLLLGKGTFFKGALVALFNDCVKISREIPNNCSFCIILLTNMKLEINE